MKTIIISIASVGLVLLFSGCSAKGMDDFSRGYNGHKKASTGTYNSSANSYSNPSYSQTSNKKRSTYYRYSNGASTQQIGNTYYHSNGTSTRRQGNTDYHSNGATSNRVGNTYYNSDGTTTIKIGNRYFNN